MYRWTLPWASWLVLFVLHKDATRGATSEKEALSPDSCFLTRLVPLHQLDDPQWNLPAAQFRTGDPFNNR